VPGRLYERRVDDRVLDRGGRHGSPCDAASALGGGYAAACLLFV
jgi:hypothetical protein